jgi:hypothetical protein
MMNPGKILSLGLLSAFLWACNSSTEPAPPRSGVDGRQIAPAINALSKVGAYHAGMGMSREVAAADSGFNPFSEEVTKALKDVGVCDNFIQLINELAQSKGDQSIMESPRFTKVISCFETEGQGLNEQSSVQDMLGIFDKCFCDGSGSVFGAIRAYAFSGYSAPQFNVYSAPVTAPGYGAPSPASGYSAPSLPGYSAPSL